MEWITKRIRIIRYIFFKPEIKKGFGGNSKVIGFKDAITGEKIAKRIYKGPEYIFGYEDVDCMIEKKHRLGIYLGK